MPIKIEIFSSPGCSKCGHAKEILRKMAEDLGADKVAWREVNILDEIDHAVELGVMSTPSIAIDGVLVFSSLPSARKLRADLERRIDSGMQD